MSVFSHCVILRNPFLVILRNGVTNGSVYIHVDVFRFFAMLKMTKDCNIKKQ